jgi:hypothetical protein
MSSLTDSLSTLSTDLSRATQRLDASAQAVGAAAGELTAEVRRQRDTSTP